MFIGSIRAFTVLFNQLEDNLLVKFHALRDRDDKGFDDLVALVPKGFCDNVNFTLDRWKSEGLMYCSQVNSIALTVEEECSPQFSVLYRILRFYPGKAFPDSRTVVTSVE